TRPDVYGSQHQAIAEPVKSSYVWRFTTADSLESDELVVVEEERDELVVFVGDDCVAFESFCVWTTPWPAPLLVRFVDCTESAGAADTTVGETKPTTPRKEQLLRV
uniref:hypothetical protein n=1 Tax=Haloferax sp. (strain Q22) TaxID=1526048 RepID=UPI001C129EA5